MYKSRTYRSFLEETFIQRNSRNPNYSLRAFARDLGIAPSRLSEVIAGKNGLSSLNAKKIALALQLDEKREEWFRCSVEANHARSRTQKQEAARRLLELERTPPQRKIRRDEFLLISEWYHLSLLELLNLKNARFSSLWIAKRLGICPSEAKSAMERLKKLGWIQKENGKWISRPEFRCMTEPTAFLAMHKYQQQLIKKANLAAKNQDPQERLLKSLVLAFPKENFSKASQEFEKFLGDFNQKYGATQGEGDDVYGITLQFFRVSSRPSENQS